MTHRKFEQAERGGMNRTVIDLMDAAKEILRETEQLFCIASFTLKEDDGEFRLCIDLGNGMRTIYRYAQDDEKFMYETTVRS